MEKDQNDIAAKYPSFSLERFLAEQKIEWRTNESGDHTEYAMNCPECQNRGEPTPDTKQRLWINSVTGFYHCYRCSWSGSLLYFIQKIASMNQKNAIKVLRGNVVDAMDNLNLKLFYPKFDPSEDEIELKSIDLPYGYEPITEPIDYLEERGIPWEYARDHDFGIGQSGYTKDRLIIPFYMNSQLVFWQARMMREPKKDEKKVLNPSGVSAKHVLYNYDTASQHKQIVLVEGAIDAIKVGDDAMSINGKNAHGAQAEWLLKTSARTLVLMLDLDAWNDSVKASAHRKAKPSSVQRAVELFRAYGFIVKAVKMPNDKDAGSYRYLSSKLREMINNAKEPRF